MWYRFLEWCNVLVVWYLKKFDYVKFLEAELDSLWESLKYERENSFCVLNKEKNTNGAWDVTVQAPGWAGEDWTRHIVGVLDNHNAINYVEMECEQSGKRYLATYQRLEGKTPHDLRMEADNRNVVLCKLLRDTVAQMEKLDCKQEQVDFLKDVTKQLEEIVESMVTETWKERKESASCV